jgi:hypothetical protein
LNRLAAAAEIVATISVDRVVIRMDKVLGTELACFQRLGGDINPNVPNGGLKVLSEGTSNSSDARQTGRRKLQR